MIKIFEKSEELDNFAAEKFSALASDSIKRKGRFTIVLAGGSTPKALYQKMASDDFRDKVEWNKVYFFFGDERNVPPESEESNFRMVNENLFAPINISETNVYRWQTDSQNAERTALDYENSIKEFFGSFPTFDLILLGMGTDGHTASLFPFTAALEENERYATENYVEKLETTRLSLTFPVINQAKNVIFLVKGADKAETVFEVLKGEFQPQKLPAQNVRLTSGKIYWFLDGEAARLL